ncbi:MAG: DUF167 domain-containing protein [Opitutae bacterium]|nr:DUF167 domain-containing protein [Opitutae bacterium]MCD8299465.1 DUF167 domain-containing protein [Opitutae bacterium]
MADENFFLLKIRAIPNAKKTLVAGMLGDAVKIKVQAVPEGGRANKEIESFIAETLGVPKKNVSVQVGATSRNKLVRVAGIQRERATKLLGL